MPCPGGIDDLGRHLGKAHLGNASVGARQEDVGHLLSQFLLFHDGALGLRRVIDADGDPLIGRRIGYLGLEIQGFGVDIPHLHIGVGDDERIGGAEPGIVLRAHVSQRAQILGGSDHQRNVLIILGGVGGVVFKGDAGCKIRNALVRLPDIIVSRVIQRKAQRSGHVDGHFFCRGDVLVGIHAVIGHHAYGRAAYAAQVVIEGVCAVRRQIIVLGLGEVHGTVRHKIKQGRGQIVPVAKGRLIGHGLGTVDRIGGNCRVKNIVETIEVLRNRVVRTIQNLLGGDGVGDRLLVYRLIGSEVVAAQGGVPKDTRLDIGVATAAVGGTQGDRNHAVLVGAVIGQGDGLGKGVASHRPDGNNVAVFRGLGHGNALVTGVAAVPVLAAENIVGDCPVRFCDTERNKGGVILARVIEQIFVVI